MAHSSKKPAQTAAKYAAAKGAATATKAINTANSYAETGRNAAESMLRVGADSMKEFFSSSTEEAQKAQGKIYAIGREGAENFARAADAFTRTVNDLVSMSRDNVEAAVEVSQLAVDMAKSMGEDMVSYANSNFTDNLELSREAFGCRNINDAFEIQSKWFSTNLNNFFTQSQEFAGRMFEFASETAEPISERVSEATERFTKSLAA